MVIVPRERPLMEGLNSYYCDILKLLEHFQGEIGPGGVHFKSSTAEAMIFFDKDEVLGGTYQDKEGEANGKDALSRLLEASVTHGFVIDVYEMDPEKVYFWAKIGTGQAIFRDLSTEFTDLEALINKMVSEKLTGTISVFIGDGKEDGIIFLSNGEIIGGSYSWSRGLVNGTEESHDQLVRKTKASGGIFHVTRIPLQKKAVGKDPSHPATKPSSEALNWLAELLRDVEVLFGRSKVKADFNRMLKRKFVQKADRYPFLDPFAAEFEYVDQRIEFAGTAGLGELTRAVIHCLAEIAEEAGIAAPFQDLLTKWRITHSEGLADLGLDA